jgi:hypothetical protein
MQTSTLIHDVSWAASVAIMEMLENVLLPQERKDAFGEIYERIKAGIEAYEVQVARQQLRMRPSRN